MQWFIPVNEEMMKCFFVFFSRLFAVQNALVQQEWRVPELLHRLLEFLTPHLTHRYKNVRDRIGR